MQQEALMVFEKFIRYAGLAVGLNPSATECEARLRGRERMMYSKTISAHALAASL
jgi:hypothetical protein